MIGDQEVAGRIEDEAARVIELGVHGETTVAGEARRTGPGNRRDDAGEIDASDAVVAAIGKQDLARREDEHRTHIAQFGRSGRAAITAKTT